MLNLKLVWDTEQSVSSDPFIHLVRRNKIKFEDRRLCDIIEGSRYGNHS